MRSFQRWLQSRNLYYGWFVVLGGFLGSLVVYGLSYSFGVFFEHLLEEFGHSRAYTSLLFSVQSFVLYALAPFVGGLIDRFGTKRLVGVALVLFLVGMIGTSQAGSLPELIIYYGVVTSIALSVLFVVSYATVPRWFDRRRGFATGLTSTGLGIGLLFVAPLASALIVALGWRFAYLVLLGFFAAALLLTLLFIEDHPRSLGLNPEGEFPNGLDTPTSSTTPWREQLQNLLDVVQTPAFGLVFGGFLMIYSTLYLVLGHLVLYSQDQGLASWVGVWSMSVIGGATSLTRMGVGIVADALGRVRVYLAAGLIIGSTTCGYGAATHPWVFVLLSVLFGIGYGGIGALMSPLIADLFGTANINAVFGSVTTAFAVSGLATPYLAGLTYDWVHTYTPVFWATGLLALLGTVLVASSALLQGAFQER